MSLKTTSLFQRVKTLTRMSARFEPPAISDNPTGWGPSTIPAQFKDMPYQPFSKSDRLGKVSDWTGATYQDRRYHTAFVMLCTPHTAHCTRHTAHCTLHTAH